jgi:MFS family permease
MTGFLIGFGMFGSFILIPQFVQMPAEAGYGFAVDTTGAGLFLLPSAAVMLVAGPIAGWLSGRRGSKLPLLLGTGFAGLSFLLMAVAHSQEWQVLLAVTLLGLGIGLSFASMANLIVEAVPQHQTGEATGMNTIMRTVGGAFGGQIAAAIVADHIDAGTGLAAESGFTAAFALGAVALAVALFAATLIPGRRATAAVGAARGSEAGAG